MFFRPFNSVLSLDYAAPKKHNYIFKIEHVATKCEGLSDIETA